MLSESPIISVCMITFNHEPYIREAIEGILMQETDFEFELVIGDDSSTDRTTEICRSYAERYPERIRLLERSKNMGMSANFAETIGQCRGKYVAFCEGDDYWINPKKLQRQTTFLESNPDYFGVCSSVLLRTGESQALRSQVLHADLQEEEDVTVDRLLEDFTLHTATFMYRNGSFDLDLITGNGLATDISVFLLVLDRGPVKYFNSADAVYRTHPGGVTFEKHFYKFYQLVSRFLDVFDGYTEFRHASAVKAKKERLEVFSLLNDPKTGAVTRVFHLLKYLVLNTGSITTLEAKNAIGLAFPRTVNHMMNIRRRASSRDSQN